MFKDLLLWLYWYPYRSLVQAMPLGWSRRLARTLGAAYFFLAGGKRRQYEREYLEVFGGVLDDKDARTAVRRAFENWQQNELEVLLYPKMDPGNISSFVRCEGMENLDKALSAGRGAMLLFAHFGANQMIMPAIGYKGYRMSQMSAPPTVWPEKQPNRKFSPMARRALDLRWEHELSLPVRHINIFGSLKGAFVALKKNEVLGIAVDGGGGIDRLNVPFLGHTAVLSKGAADIAYRTGCAVLPTFMVNSGDGAHRLIIEAPLGVEAVAGKEEYMRRVVRLFMGRLEHFVIKYPCHYLGFLALRRLMELEGDAPLIMKETCRHEDTAC